MTQITEIKKPMYVLNAANIMESSTFRKYDGTLIEDVAQYVKDYFAEKRRIISDEFQIFIGSDSQRVRKGRLTLYSTAICLYTVGKGAHVIYAKTKRNDIAPTARKTRKNDKKKRPADTGLFYRLQWEVEYSMQAANYLNKNNVFAECEVAQVHFDIAINPEHDSNIAYSYAVGYAKNAGYNPRTKPDAIAASYAADMCVRR